MKSGGNDWMPSARGLRLLWVLVGCGIVAFVSGLFFAPERIWADLLLWSYALVGLGLAGVFFVALEYVSGASWSVAIRRIPEAMTMALPVGGAGVLAVLFLHPSLYPWSAGVWTAGVGSLGFKQAWLSRPFFLVRALGYLAVWSAFAWALLRNSHRQDSSGDFGLTRRNARLAAGFMVVFGFTFWLASYDWIMSLEPRWYSTIFGVYNFAGMFTSGLAVMAILAVWLRKAGPLRRVVTEQHLLDLGRLILAFTTFWAYIWFSQYMLIWYANLPEETSYFVRRSGPGWGKLFILNFLLNWVIPFLVLLARSHKQNGRILVAASVVVLLGRALDLYLMVIPPFVAGKPVFGVWDGGILLGAIGVFVLVFLRGWRRAAPVPIGDPFLRESLHYYA